MTRSVNDWLDAYAVSHQHPTNKRLHWLCVPAIVVSLVGILWSLPVPAAFDALSPWLNWGSLLLIAALGYYLLLSVPLALGMLPFVLATAALVLWLDTLSVSLLALSVSIFVIAWIGQFIGHRIEGAKPSFFEDLQFLMIGPLWILAAVFRKLGLRY